MLHRYRQSGRVVLVTVVALAVLVCAAVTFLGRGRPVVRAAPEAPNGSDRDLPEARNLGSNSSELALDVPPRYHGVLIRRRLRHFPQKLLTLTFDDGPDPKVTPRVLDTLDRYGARATFFVIGKHVRRHPQLLKEIAERGHAVGSHGYAHVMHPTEELAERDLQANASLIREITGRETLLYRPPGGFANSAGTHAAVRNGMAVLLWTINSADAKEAKAEEIAANVLRAPRSGDIVLMHDGPGHEETAAALPAILSALEKKGYRFVTVPELLQAWDEWRRSSGLDERLEARRRLRTGADHSSANHHTITSAPASGAVSNSTTHSSRETDAIRHR